MKKYIYILDYHFYKITQQLTEKIPSNLHGNTKHKRHAKKQQTIQEHTRKIMAHVHKNNRTKSIRTRKKTNTHKPMVPIQQNMQQLPILQ